MKTIRDIATPLRTIDFLEGRLAREEDPRPSTFHACDCPMRASTRTGICANCLRGMIQEVRDGVKAGESWMVKEQKAIPDGVYIHGTGMKKNLDNNA